jgi:hypothetical protein
LITQIIFGEDYVSRSSSLCSVLHSSGTSSSRLKYPQRPILEHPRPVFLPQYETSFRTHTKQQAKLQFCLSESLSFWIANRKTKYSALNDSKHSLASVCSYFLDECNFDSLGLFPNV